MRGKIEKWHQFIDVHKLQALQDAIAKAANISLTIVNYLGESVSSCSNGSRFCETVQQEERLASRCTSCFSRGGFEAAKNNKPFLFRCHLGLFELAIPIMIEGHYAGSLLAGQFLLDDESLMQTTEIILPTSNNLSEQSIYPFHDIPKLTTKQLDSLMEVLFTLCDLIATEAISHHREKTAYQALLKRKNIFTTDSFVEDLELTDMNISDRDTHVLNPLFAFMRENPDTDLSLSDAAALCHLSECYFSRIFTTKTGKYYSIYKRTKKIERAKQLLEQTDLLVTQISDTLGFNDPSYFIRTFKKHEGTTPYMYRKQFM